MSNKYTLGIDIGSTTVKIAILDENDTLLFADYQRHFANIQETLASLLRRALEQLGPMEVHPVITGSGGLTISRHLEVPFVQEVVAVHCRAAGAPLTVADFDALSSVCDTLEGQIFNYGPYKGLRLPLLGGHQLRNAAVALTTIDVLRQRGWHIDESAVRQGLAQTAWPGRFQVVRRQPTIILDGGHNPQCMVSLAAAIREYLPGQPVTVLTGVLADKDYGKMYDQLAPLAARFITVTPHNPRALDAGELAAFLRRYGKPVTACDTIRVGVARMLAETAADGAAVGCGSLYLLGDVVQSLEMV